MASADSRGYRLESSGERNFPFSVRDCLIAATRSLLFMTMTAGQLDTVKEREPLPSTSSQVLMVTPTPSGRIFSMEDFIQGDLVERFIAHWSSSRGRSSTLKIR